MKNPESASSLGFDEVYNRPIIFIDKYILSHEPVFIPETRDFINIHGHYLVDDKKLDFGSNYLPATCWDILDDEDDETDKNHKMVVLCTCICEFATANKDFLNTVIEKAYEIWAVNTH